MKWKRIAGGIAALLAVIVAGYSIYWRVVAPKVDAAIDAWVAMQRQAGATLKFERTPVLGFPWEFRSAFHNVDVSQTVNGERIEWGGSDLELSLSPFDLETIRFNSSLLSIFFKDRNNTLLFEMPKGKIAFRGDGALADIAIEAGDTKWAVPGLVISKADAIKLSVSLPKTPPRSDRDPAMDFAIDLKNVMLPPGKILVTEDPLTQVEIAGSLKGPIEIAPLQQALSSWSNQGGTLEVKSFTLAQPPLTLAGSATLALDSDLQPIGAANMTARGLSETIDLLAQQGRLATADAVKFKLFVKGAQSPGADGVPEVATGLSLQNGTLSWGPFRLARVPRILWQ
jgi:hypothetical protein